MVYAGLAAHLRSLAKIATLLGTILSVHASLGLLRTEVIRIKFSILSILLLTALIACGLSLKYATVQHEMIDYYREKAKPGDQVDVFWLPDETEAGFYATRMVKDAVLVSTTPQKIGDRKAARVVLKVRLIDRWRLAKTDKELWLQSNKRDEDQFFVD